jgi:hypothetical protein
VFSIRSVLCAALTLGLLLATTPAEARFGKHSSSSSSKDDDKKDDDKKDDDRPQKDDRTHEASAIGTERSYQTDSGSSSSSSTSDDNCCHEPRSHVVVESDFGFWAFIFSSGNHGAPLDAAYVEPGVNGEVHGRRHAAPLSLRLGLQGGPMGGGTVGDAFIGIDGERLGIAAQVSGLSLPTDDGSAGSDTITLLEAHLTYALVSLDRVRLRAEAGVSSANAPDIAFVGPSLGMSMEACVVGPLDIEVRAQATPLPYRQLDGSAGLALHLGALVVRGGVRGLLLDDAGEVDGVQHVDTFGGPYFGLGLTF